jgi:hypothetical protein
MEVNMQLSSPTAVTWWVTVVAAVVGLILQLNLLPFLAGFAMFGFWLLLLAFILLAVACIVKGL